MLVVFEIISATILFLGLWMVLQKLLAKEEKPKVLDREINE